MYESQNMIRCLDTGKMISVDEVPMAPTFREMQQEARATIVAHHSRSPSTDQSYTASASEWSNSSSVSVAGPEMMEVPSTPLILHIQSTDTHPLISFVQELEHASSNVVVVDTFNELSDKVSCHAHSSGITLLSLLRLVDCAGTEVHVSDRN